LNYKQHLASAMLCIGDGDRQGALKEFEMALQEARRIDPQGPREAEVLMSRALFHEQSFEEEEASKCRLAANAIYLKFQDLSE
jgi:hypothetical protein